MVAAPWLLPTIAVVATPWLTPWVAMWFVAASLFAAFKWTTFREHCSFPYGWRVWAYFLVWPGLEAERFLGKPHLVDRPGPALLLSAISSSVFGVLLIGGVLPLVPWEWSCLRGAIGFAGIVSVLHFGSFGLLAWAWRRMGIDAPPVMDRPFAAASLADFWGRRWNTAYRRVSFDLFFRPLTTRLGTEAALLVSFLASGLLHELVISIPARGGYGGPTAYFLIQGVGLLWERTPPLRRAFLRKPSIGRLFAATVLLAPLGLLFPPPFLERVIAPFLSTIGA